MIVSSSALKIIPIQIFFLCLFASACVSANSQQHKYDVADDKFLAVEPTVLGLIASPTIWQVLEPIAGQTPDSMEGDQSLKVYVRKAEGGYRADVIASGLSDDSLMAQHVRLDLRQEPEGWFITNALVRYKCYRSEAPAQWQTNLCM